MPDHPYSAICQCGRRRGFLPKPGADLIHVREVLSRGHTLPLIGVLICRHCDLDPHYLGFPRLGEMLDIGQPGG
jgi:hypothetical protein